ncbi:hypothetical protein BH11PSE11_BH11PSE11_04670 [soil metagenome]
MRRRLYFMLPDVRSARALFEALLLARIEQGHMRFCARENILPPDMPEAGFFHSSDLVHGVELGMLVGGGAGLVAGILLMLFPLQGIELQLAAIFMTVLGGAFFGAWVSGMVAAGIPNSRLRAFQDGIDRGQILLILDVPFHRVSEIENMIAQGHSIAKFGGLDPHVPIFP